MSSRASLNEQLAKLPDADQWVLGWEAVVYALRAMLARGSDIAGDSSTLARCYRALDLRACELALVKRGADLASTTEEKQSTLEELLITTTNAGEFDEALKVIEELGQSAWTDAVKAFVRMMAIAGARLGRLSRRVTMTAGSFLDEALPSCDAIVASYSLHHIRTARAKLAFYGRCYRALRPGGVLINGDCAPASTPRGFARDLDVWFAHLAKSFGGRAKGRRVYESWADEDTYVPLAEEIRLLQRAGFAVDVPWRRSPFAVIVACRQ